MTKAGAKLLSAAREAVSVARGESEPAKITVVSVSVRLGPESLLPPALDTEIIKVASAQADLEDRGE